MRVKEAVDKKKGGSWWKPPFAISGLKLVQPLTFESGEVVVEGLEDAAREEA